MTDEHECLMCLITKTGSLTPIVLLLIMLSFLVGCEVKEGNTSKTEAQPVPLDQLDQRPHGLQDQVADDFLPKDGPAAQDFSELHNLFQISDTILSGAEPESEAAFTQLADLGVKTILSVDGATPKVELANKHGLRYVHIPIGYDGLDRQAIGSFTRAADELTETIYVHCHHGKHRGPAGAAAICVARGLVRGDQALQILERAGTSKEYEGLWRDVKEFRRPPANATLPSLVSVAAVGSMAAAMAKIGRARDHLKLCSNSNWETPPDHPDINPAHQALLLREGLYETVRALESSREYEKKMLDWMRDAEQKARQFERSLKTGDSRTLPSTFATLQSHCTRCHHVYR